jgi:putative ABC transport system substrate-binding protein
VLVGLAPVLIVSPAAAQRRPVIGVLSPFVDAESTFLNDLRDGLAAHGLHDGKEIAIEYRSAGGRVEALPRLAEELARMKVEVIVTASAPAIRFAQQATTTIPIVMARVGDAVDQGFVKSLAQPGGNITGISWLAPELSAKRLELLKQALPGITRVGVLREASAGAASVIAVQAAAAKLGIVPSVFEVREPAEFPTALAAMSEAGAEGVEILEGLMIFNSVRPLVALIEARRTPAIFPDISFVEAGGLMSYGASVTDAYRQVGVYTARILKGTKPADLPVLQSSKFELVINHQTARMLGLTVPDKLLATADEVIE